MWPDRASNSIPLVLESDALPTSPRGPAIVFFYIYDKVNYIVCFDLMKIFI